MSMKKLEHLKDVLCEELDELAEKSSISAADLEHVYKFTASIKNIDKIIMADRYSKQGSYGESYRGSYDGGSYDGDSYDGGSYRRSYDGGTSMRGRYSYADEKDVLAEKIQSMMDSNMNQNDRMILQKAMNIIRG